MEDAPMSADMIGGAPPADASIAVDRSLFSEPTESLGLPPQRVSAAPEICGSCVSSAMHSLSGSSCSGNSCGRLPRFWSRERGPVYARSISAAGHPVAVRHAPSAPPSSRATFGVPGLRRGQTAVHLN